MLQRGLYFTDIHFGKKSNSSVHLDDCSRFVDWVCSIAKDPIHKIDFIAFLGDWFENRSNINIFTLQCSHENADKLNGLGIPVFFVIGNHDLAERNSRETYSTFPMNAFSNFTIVDEPIEVKNIMGGVLFSPFLMKDEYTTLTSDCKVWAGHFEFKGFVLTGGSFKLEHGPDASQFGHVTALLSGHFHKRQSSKNVHYIGNTFPMDFGDSGDSARGVAIYDHSTHQLSYIDWTDGPSYLSTTVSRLQNGDDVILPKSHVYVDVDTSMKYGDLRAFQDTLRQQHPSLRSLEFNENSTMIVELSQLNAAGELLTNDADAADVSVSLSGVSDIVLNLLQHTEIPSYDNAMLIELYKEVV